MKRALAAGSVVLLLGILWLAWRGDGDRKGPGNPPPAAQEAGRPALPAQGDATPATDAAATGRTVPSTTPSTETQRTVIGPMTEGGEGTVTLRGRCVDSTTGAAMQGCIVELRRSSGGKTDVVAPPPQTTGPDGRFSLCFVLPPGEERRVYIHGSFLVPVYTLFSSPKPGSVEDFGDIALQYGSMVSGRIATTRGVPEKHVWVYLNPDPSHPLHSSKMAQAPRQDRFQIRPGLGTTSQTDGAFTFHDPVPFGTWRVRTKRRIEPASLTIPHGQARTTLDILTKPSEEVDSVSGLVLDDTGAPVEGAQVLARSSSGRAIAETTDKQGRFRLERNEHAPANIAAFELQCRGFEDLDATRSASWGDKDLEFVMRRGLSIDVLVVDRDSGEPIEDYGLRCFPVPRQMRMDLRAYRLRDEGHHPRGRATITGIRRGRQVLVVEAKGDAWQVSDLVYFEVTDQGAAQQKVALSRAVTRTLRVRGQDGRPVAGTAVELLRPIGSEPITLATLGLPVDSLWHAHDLPGACVLVQGKTGGNGEFLLRGAARQPFTLRVLGPGHPPLLEPGVTLAAGAPPLVVTVRNGAVVKGKIGPPELLRRFRPAQNALPGAFGNATRQQLSERSRPGVYLLRERDGRRFRHPPEDRAKHLVVGENGDFELTAVPAGTWDLYVALPDDFGGTEFIETLTDLADGEVREIDIDLPHLLPARLTGVVMMEGSPLANASIRLLGTAQDRRGSETRFATTAVNTGPDGTFAFEPRPGKYRLLVTPPALQPGSRAFPLPAVESIALRSGQQVHQICHVVEHAKLHLRLVDERGQPVPGTHVWATNRDRSWRAHTSATDAEGRATIDRAPLGTVLLSFMPKQPADSRAGQAAATPEDAMVSLGEVEVARKPSPRDSGEFEILVPARAGR